MPSQRTQIDPPEVESRFEEQYLTVFIPVEIHRRLKSFKKKNGTLLKYIVTNSIREYLERKGA